jgi:hypothetical protein
VRATKSGERSVNLLHFLRRTIAKTLDIADCISDAVSLIAMSPIGTKRPTPIRQACPLPAKAAVTQRILVLPADPRELGGPSVSGNSVANVAWGSASLASPFVLPSPVLGLSDPSLWPRSSKFERHDRCRIPKDRVMSGPVCIA